LVRIFTGKSLQIKRLRFVKAILAHNLPNTTAVARRHHRNRDELDMGIANTRSFFMLFLPSLRSVALGFAFVASATRSA
jgi:hypothetical protein